MPASSPPAGGQRSAARRRRERWRSALALSVSLAIGGSVVLVTESHSEAAKVTVDEKVAVALQQADPGAVVENFLLVGSDTRAGADPGSPDYGGIGSADETTGQRSDTIMILRHNRQTGEAGLLSLPRDLWVEIAGTGKHSRINSAFSHGTDVLVKTITEDFGIPINHYIEVDFSGFKTLVDAIGGVDACFDNPTRDKNTGLLVTNPGCYTLDGVEGLQYTRSRHFEEFVDGKWREDPRSDLGRIDRQQRFIVAAVNKAVAAIGQNPFVIDNLLKAARQSLTVDPGLDLLSVAARFKDLVGKNLYTLQVPIVPKRIDGNDVLLVDEARAGPILDYFRGATPSAPPGQPAVTPTGAPAG